MLKSKRRLGEAPKKRKNNKKVYVDEDEFGGSVIDDSIDEQNVDAVDMVEQNADVQQQRKKHISIVDDILKIGSTQEHKINKIEEPVAQKKEDQIEIVKAEQNTHTKIKSKSKSKNKPIQQKKVVVSNNWAQFLKTQSKQPNQSKKSKTTINVKPQQTEYVCLDCEYVECEYGLEELARISIVDENLKQLYEGYIRPKSKIVDYRTHISGIAYTHIKNAPLWEAEKPKVQKILLNKILVGHTIDKDLQIMGMQGWFGFKNVININQFSQYQQNGKVQGLKRLALVFLEKNIQSGTHSSLQDAKVTMQLFKIKKDKILLQIKRQQKESERLLKKKTKIQNSRKTELL